MDIPLIGEPASIFPDHLAVGSRKYEAFNSQWSQWVSSPVDQRRVVEERMRPHLVRHATSLHWQILKREDKHSANDAAQHVIDKLPRFDGKSLLSTWTRTVLRNKIRSMRRQQLRRREHPIPADFEIDIAARKGRGHELFEENHSDAEISWKQILDLSTKDEREMIHMLFELGYTQRWFAEHERKALGTISDALARWRAKAKKHYVGPYKQAF